MSKLDEIINEEHEMLMQSQLTWDRFAQSVFDLLKEKLSNEDYLKNENEVVECFNQVEDFAFTQGFLRGIAAVKGGVV